MNYNNYDTLGIMPSATRQDIDEAYSSLRAKYQQDRFLVGQAGEDAAEKLQEIEVAYRDIIAELDRAETAAQNDSTANDDFAPIDSLAAVRDNIKNDNLDIAQNMLDNTGVRTAEWHYLQSVIFYKRNWFLEAKKQLEFAVDLEPNNQRYIDSLDKLNKIIASKTISNDDLRGTTTTTSGTPYSNGTCTGSSCTDCLMCNMCCNCMSCMGGC